MQIKVYHWELILKKEIYLYYRMLIIYNKKIKKLLTLIKCEQRRNNVKNNLKDLIKNFSMPKNYNQQKWQKIENKDLQKNIHFSS